MRAVKEQAQPVEMTPEQLMAQLASGNLKQDNPNVMLLDKTLLPSRGKFYDGDIKVHKFTGMDIKNLSKMTNETANPIINNVLSKCVEGLEVNRILLNDKLWFIYYLRSYTYNNRPIDMIGTCNACKHKKRVAYTFDNHDVTYYDKELPTDPVRLPNGDMVTFEFPTIGTEIQVNRIKHDPNVLDNIDEEYMLISSYLKEINGKRISIKEAYDYLTLGAASADDFSFIVNFMNDYVFGAKTTATFTCDCGETFKCDVLFNQQFFMPR